MGGEQIVPIHPVVAHQKPARETLFNLVDAVGQCRLTQLDHEGLCEPQQMLMQRRTGRHRAPQIIGLDPQRCTGGLNEALVRRAICTKQDGHAGQALPSDDPGLDAATLRSDTGSGRWTRIEDSWAGEQRVGWWAMSGGGEPWRGLLSI